MNRAIGWLGIVGLVIFGLLEFVIQIGGVILLFWGIIKLAEWLCSWAAR